SPLLANVITVLSGSVTVTTASGSSTVTVMVALPSLFGLMTASSISGATLSVKVAVSLELFVPSVPVTSLSPSTAGAGTVALCVPSPLLANVITVLSASVTVTTASASASITVMVALPSLFGLMTASSISGATLSVKVAVSLELFVPSVAVTS